MNHNSKKHRNQESTTEGELFLDLLADEGKLKPISKTLNVERIEEHNSDSEDSDLMQKIRQSKKSDFLSSESSTTSSRRRSSKYSSKRSEKRSSKRSNSSTNSSITQSTQSTQSSKSSKSSRRHSRYDSSSNSHKKTDNYVNDFNNIRISSKPEETKETHYIPKYTSEREKKFKRMALFFALEEIRKDVKLTKDYTLQSNIEDMEDEVKFHTEREQKKVAIQMGKDGLLKGVQLIERGNKYFDPFGLKLNGFHKQMCGNINNYDNVMGELHEKYKDYIGKVEPELKFVYMFGGAALSFHYSQQYVEEKGLQGMVERNPGMFEKIQSTIAGFVETNVGKEEKVENKEEKAPGLTRQEMYRRMKEQQPEHNNIPVAEHTVDDELHDSQQNVNNTISQMLGGNNPRQMSGEIRPQQMSGVNNPLHSTRNITIQKPRKITQMINKVTRNGLNNNVITLNDTATSRNVDVMTVDSESTDGINMNIGRRKNRLRVR